MITTAIALTVLIGAVVFVWLARRAPLGYQDETGFHPGVQTKS